MVARHLYAAFTHGLGAGSNGPGPVTPMRRRRLALFLAAAFVSPFAFLDLALPAARLVAPLGAAWVAVLVLAGVLQREGRPASSRTGVVLGVLGSVGAAAGKVLLTGGSRSPFYGLLLALAPAVALVVPEVPPASVGAGALAVGVGVAIRLAEGRGLMDAAFWAALAAGIAGLSVTAAWLARRQLVREIEHERRGRVALWYLAEARASRLELVRIAEGDRLAAAIFREVNGPLGAVRSNLNCLLRNADAPAAERRELLLDSADALERIAHAIGHLPVAAGAAGSGSLTHRPGRPFLE